MKITCELINHVVVNAACSKTSCCLFHMWNGNSREHGPDQLILYVQISSNQSNGNLTGQWLETVNEMNWKAANHMEMELNSKDARCQMKAVLSYQFWMRTLSGNVFSSTGGRYLTIPEVGNKRSGRGARLVLPLTPPWNDGNLCLSFRHKLAGHHVGMLQVFVKKGKQYSPAVWGRTGGNGWRHTQITLWGTGLESVSQRTSLTATHICKM